MARTGARRIRLLSCRAGVLDGDGRDEVIIGAPGDRDFAGAAMVVSLRLRHKGRDVGGGS